MIRVKFNPADLNDPEQKKWWTDWLKRADGATDKVIDSFETWLAGSRNDPFHFEFNSTVWKDLKDWLMDHVFYEKCAYCERIISGYYGDAEHYRPKAAVLHKIDTGEMMEPECNFEDPLNPAAGQFLTLGHPGYFWLAYDWRNLLPSCVYCNSGLGKNERFDVQKKHLALVKLDQQTFDAIPADSRPRGSKKWPGYYYLTPAMLDEREGPLLLNPLNAPDERNPHRHIRFGTCGTVAAVKKSPFGVNTIEIFRLRDDKLIRARHAAQETFRDKFYDRMRKYDPNSPGRTEADALLVEYAEGRHPHSAAALDYYEFVQSNAPKPPPR